MELVVCYLIYSTQKLPISPRFDEGITTISMHSKQQILAVGGADGVVKLYVRERLQS